MKDFDLEIKISDKISAVRTYTIFPNKAFVYALMVPSFADQLLPQFLMEQFHICCLYNIDTLNICMKELVWKK